MLRENAAKMDETNSKFQTFWHFTVGNKEKSDDDCIAERYSLHLIFFSISLLMTDILEVCSHSEGEKKAKLEANNGDDC